METRVEQTVIRVVQGDITAQDVDVIVNAANSSLLGGGGVDGAIHRAGGPQILEECKAIVAEIGSLSTGRAVITSAGKMPARHVIHTVGPIYQDGYHGENTKLEQAYVHSLELARDEGLRTIAFPAISTGAYRFPFDEAALIALNAFVRFARENPDALDEIRMVLYSVDDFDSFKTRFSEVIDTMLG